MKKKVNPDKRLNAIAELYKAGRLEEKVCHQKDAEPEGRVITFLGTSNTEDRDGDVLTADGWELENYKKNPVFLYAHRYDELPIGRALAVRQVDNGLEFDIEFVSKEIYAFADTVFKLYKAKVLNAVSVGFISKSRRQAEDGTREIVLKELLELSAVPVPSQADALQRAYGDAQKKGIIDKIEYETLVKDLVDDEQPQMTPSEIERVDMLERDVTDMREKSADLEARIVTLENKISELQKGIDGKAVYPYNNVYKELLDGISGLRGKKPDAPTVERLIAAIEKLEME